MGAVPTPRVTWLLKKVGLLPQFWPKTSALSQHIDKPVVEEIRNSRTSSGLCEKEIRKNKEASYINYFHVNRMKFNKLLLGVLFYLYYGICNLVYLAV